MKPKEPVKPLSAEVHGDYLVKIMNQLDAILQELQGLRAEMKGSRRDEDQ